ncbi:NAD-dependent epimerase/dehydratase family protein [Yinghuangia seranimata]|uniref:NAD-dependent epimerase/dehydratase family protein n=1 Tax=Yinghuangia seranimata TaxID=408067 RepID=UPI00248C5249|nr:NAD(P)-dependent oxidoreductase [Yinghuangia seranimata]MDI2130409.1 NAD(P)-dependent oxidoreductase [Yinghuangia seranimata]
MTDTKNVLLAGATGVFGRHVAEELTSAGYTVLALGRGVENDVRADLMDRERLLRAVEGVRADVVVHAATALREAPMRHKDMYATDALRVDGTANLVEAARAVGARRLVAESMAFGYGYGDHGEQVLTEADPFGAPGADKECQRHVDAMRVKEALMLGADGVEGVALRFGLFYGPGGTENIVELLRKRKLPAVAGHGRVLPWIELRDAARAVALAVEGGRPGEAYNIVDDTPFGFGEHVKAVAEAFDTPKPMNVPTWLMRPYSYAYKMATTSMRVSNAKARDELGWAPLYPDCVSGLADLALATA